MWNSAARGDFWSVEILWLETAIGLGVAGYGLRGGFAIINGDTKGKQLAERYLIARLIVVSVGLAFMVSMVSNEPSTARSAVSANALGRFVREVVFFAIWFGYFRNSTAVAKRYGPADAGPGVLSAAVARQYAAGSTIELPNGGRIADSAMPVLQTRRITVLQAGRVMVKNGEAVSEGKAEIT